MTHRPQQHNFIDTPRDFTPPPPINLNGDTRPEAVPLTEAELRLYEHGMTVGQAYVDDIKAGRRPLANTPTVPTPATHSPATPAVRYVEGIAHVAPPQMVPDGWDRSREAHLLDRAIKSMASDPTDAVEAAERAGQASWQALRRWLWFLLAFAAGGALVGTLDWLRAVGRI